MYLTVAAILLALGALGGLVMAARVFTGRKVPAGIAVLHGILAASGLVLVLVSVLMGLGGSTTRIAFGVLLVAALGGVYLLSFHLRNAAHPRALVVVHALVAAAGFLTLLSALF